ncbi:MAG: UvrD-helicase domain-containing protein [Acidimicrobiia bacterium]|nr:UvrD-helicase domain-containing protein [Acidimicrobiia bacterium]
MSDPTASRNLIATDVLLQGLNEAQRRAVTSEAAPLCILAGAGSGKTRVLTRRIAWRVRGGTADPRHVLALTFTRKAAGELSGRLAALGVRDQVAAGTFHAIAYAQLRRRWADRGERPPALLDRKVRLLAPLLAGHRRATVQPADVATEIEWAKARFVGPAHYEAESGAAGRRPALPLTVVASLYERYEEEKRRRGLVDFDDLLMLCTHALHADEEYASTQRWRFRHLFVDEFQDVNPVQFRLLEGWLGERRDLCVVGDPNQAIFGWNGADARYLTDFAGRFPGAEAVRLDDNYRSSPQILAVADAVLTGARPERSRPLRSNRPDGPVPAVRSWASDRDEARAVARAVRRRESPATPLSAIAVLARTNAQLLLFEEALTAAGIPYRVKGGASFLAHAEVRQALDELRRRAVNSPLSHAIADLVEMAAEGDPDRRQHLEGLVRLAREHSALDRDATVDGFFAWLRATVGSDDRPADAKGVELATFHGAKGLEWPLVFVVGLERGLVPIAQADTPAARAEERRLLYVAVTRAEHELHCSWAERRTFGARTLTRTPSPYLAPIEAAAKAGSEGTPGDWRRFLDDGRRRLGSTSARRPRGRLPVLEDADPRLFEALKSWRAATAKRSGVPAYVIFHDATLAALARARPRDHRALLAVPGLGPVKAERYGEAVLAVLANAS